MADKHEVLIQLLTDDNDVDANDLFALLSPFIKINKSSKNIIFLDSTLNHPLKNKVLLFLLGKKALFLLGLIETDRIKPKDIIEETGISKGSILPNLMTLKSPKGGSLVTSDSVGYYITSHQVSKIKTRNIININEKNN